MEVRVGTLGNNNDFAMLVSGDLAINSVIRYNESYT
jgi:hypothetical protein